MKRLLTALLILVAPLAAFGGNYDPLAAHSNECRTVQVIVKDSRRTRDIPILVYLPQATNAAPVVIFSHGLGGSRHGGAYLGRHWTARGYTAVFVQHPGSDSSVWKDVSRRERMESLEKAASGRSFKLRVEDIPAVIDQLETWNGQRDSTLSGRLDLNRIGMSGHSFGAVTTQAVSGQTAAWGKVTFTEPRIKAACAFSPSSPRLGKPEHAFGAVQIPWMLMTGTKDLSVIGNADLASRLAVFPALPDGGKYEVVLHNAEHSGFSDRALPGDTEPRNPNHHRAILALSTAFWDAHLNGNPDARRWLDGTGPRSVLGDQDRWLRK
jgi:predicted dienelactone hydrolase